MIMDMYYLLHAGRKNRCAQSRDAIHQIMEIDIKICDKTFNMEVFQNYMGMNVLANSLSESGHVMMN